jgi:hypothetical protein
MVTDGPAGERRAGSGVGPTGHYDAMTHDEHNPGEPEFGEHSDDAPHNPGEPEFGDGHDEDTGSEKPGGLADPAFSPESAPDDAGA